MGLLDQAHSFAQGASNGVAGSLTGPVDGLAWLLRKAGVPVPEAPMGGSDWMRNVGLMQEPKERIAGLLGEGIGSALPTVIAGKAPQIANGLLQMERNAMAPRTLNPQTGAIVWHGSPHKFDKFDSSKIGTGEGAQAYGHGLYLAESPEVAKGYKTTLSPYELVKDGKQIPYEQMDTVAAGIASDIASKKGDVKAVRSMYEIMAKQKFGGDVAKQRLAALDSMGANVSAEKGGSLYKVDLPDEAIAKMLDWDKPMSQQPAFDSLQQLARKRATDDAIYQATEAARAKMPKKPINEADWMNALFSGASPADDALLRELTQKEMAKLDLSAMTEKQLQSMKRPDQTWEMMGKNFYEALSNSTDAKKASDLLRSQGIPGIRYLDGGSRGAGAGSSNYVVFPGNEGLLKILERNGQGLLGN